MSHYDLYASLGLPTTADSASLAAELDRRMSSADRFTGAQYEELRCARLILGDPQRRSIYDVQRQNPAAREITFAALQELAELPLAPVTDTQNTLPVTPPESPRRPRPGWIVPSVVAVSIIVISVVAIWAITSGRKDNTDNTGAGLSFSEAPTIRFTTRQPSTEQPTTSITSTTSPAPSAWTEQPQETNEPRQELPSDSLGIQQGEYGYGLSVRERCDSGGTGAKAVFTGAGTAKCNFAEEVASELAGTSAKGTSPRDISVYSTNLDQSVSLRCKSAQDSDRDALWKCSVKSSQSIIYVYP